MDLSKECIYEIYVPSFCDGNHDLTGDLEGIISRLDYLEKTGTTILWLTPFYPSPGIDQGYDISDYLSVDPLYGSMDQLRELIRQAHQRKLKIIIDMVLNHTSTEHRWFQESVRSPQGPYGDYYIWYREIPDNWESFMSGSAWEYRQEREAYYYHAFSTGQACLNWQNPRVMEEMLEIMYFWLDQGVDGFRFDVINFLKTDQLFEIDNPVSNTMAQDQLHLYDKNQPGCPHMVERLCKKLREKKPDVFLLGEVGEEDVAFYRPYVGKSRLDTCFYFNIGSLKQLDAGKIAEAVLQSETVDGMTTLFFSSHDMKRFYHRLCYYDRELAELLVLFMYTAKGIPVIYQGDEQFLRDKELHTLRDISDIQGIRCYEQQIAEGKSEAQAFHKAKEAARDYSRELMPEAGTVAKEWMELIKLRKAHKTLQNGAYGIVKARNDMLFYNRIANEEEINICLNFGCEMQRIEIPEGAQLLYGKLNNGRQLEAHKGIVWMGVSHEKGHNAEHS